jgi:hypothetical protein
MLRIIIEEVAAVLKLLRPELPIKLDYRHAYCDIVLEEPAQAMIGFLRLGTAQSPGRSCEFYVHDHHLHSFDGKSFSCVINLNSPDAVELIVAAVANIGEREFKTLTAFANVSKTRNK